MTNIISELREKLDGIPPSELIPIRDHVVKSTQELRWVPNPGPQTEGYNCLADELYYGGEAGGGKSDLLCGLALNVHKQALILRRMGDDADEIADRFLEILGNRDGYNGTKKIYKNGDHAVKFTGCKDEKDKERHKGRAKDLYGFDEIGDFTKTQYKFITGWNRSKNPKQRCRIVCTGNPPTNPAGLWVIEYWGAWLDPKHPNPAKDGELRWYTTNPFTGKEVEVDGRGPHKFKDANGDYYLNKKTGEPDESLARSRTFIRAQLDDNIDLSEGDYQSILDSLPIELRGAYRDGDFGAGIKDHPLQVIPTDWIIQAQERWTERPPYQVPMCAMGVDPAGGGEQEDDDSAQIPHDDNAIAPRYDGWFAPIIIIPGADTPLGKDVAGEIVKLRKDGALVIVDCGGGYGGSTYKTLKENDIDVKSFKGSAKAVARTVEGQIKFVNKRAESYWRLREALDPSQEWGSPIMLPPDMELRADLAATRFSVTPQGILLEPKKNVKKRIGRSPGKGDAVTMSWSEGQKQIAHLYKAGSGSEQGLSKGRGRQSTANMGKRKGRRTSG